MGDTPLPPWLACPEIPHGSIGWRMGYGEDVMMNWHDWFRQASETQANDYFQHYIPPEEWRDWVASVQKHYLDMKNG